MGWLKKLIPKEIYKPIKSIIDPAIDFTVGLVKAVISPFTGAFNMPDESVNFVTRNDYRLQLLWLCN